MKRSRRPAAARITPLLTAVADNAALATASYRMSVGLVYAQELADLDAARTRRSALVRRTAIGRSLLLFLSAAFTSAVGKLLVVGDHPLLAVAAVVALVVVFTALFSALGALFLRTLAAADARVAEHSRRSAAAAQVLIDHLA